MRVDVIVGMRVFVRVGVGWVGVLVVVGRTLLGVVVIVAVSIWVSVGVGINVDVGVFTKTADLISDKDEEPPRSSISSR